MRIGTKIPLAAELKFIFATWSDAIVMIDDFKVEGDDEYAFDDYGSQKTLHINYVRPLISEYAPRYYFPSAKAAEESGARRGSIVILGQDLRPAATFLHASPVQFFE